MLIAISLSQNSSSNLFELLELPLVVLLRKTSDILNVSCLCPKFNIYQRLLKIILIFPLMIMEVLVHDHCYPSLT